jgi:hypothetical protein
MPQSPWRPMSTVQRDGSTVIVLAEDFSCTRAFMWDVKANCWMQFGAAWTDYDIMARYTYDEDLDGYGWVPAPDKMHEKSTGSHG